jgi:hypothetical protein
VGVAPEEAAEEAWHVKRWLRSRPEAWVGVSRIRREKSLMRVRATQTPTAATATSETAMEERMIGRGVAPKFGLLSFKLLEIIHPKTAYFAGAAPDHVCY